LVEAFLLLDFYPGLKYGQIVSGSDLSHVAMAIRCQTFIRPIVSAWLKVDLVVVSHRLPEYVLPIDIFIK
jgi:hypothetical protein